jgi:hypothetical protein
MKPAAPRNLPASVAARLRDRSRRTGDDYQLLLGTTRTPSGFPGRENRGADPSAGKEGRSHGALVVAMMVTYMVLLPC